MLKRLYIDNFRCFVNFEYKPKRKQLLLGANGSGKSSLLDAIRAVQDFVCGIEGGNFFRVAVQNSKTRWLNLPKQVFEIEAELQGRRYVYRLEIKVESELSDLVLAESLKVDDNPILEYSDGALSLYKEDADDTVTKPGTEISDASSNLGTHKDFRVEANRFFTWLSKDLICLKINPKEMRDAGMYSGFMRPGFDMRNIVDWYLNLEQYDSHGLSKFRSSLQETLDGLESTGSEDEMVSILSECRKTGRAELIISFWRSDRNVSRFKLMELSEGQRCLIALHMILHFLIEKGHTVLLDEPDNFISLREIQPWLLQAEAAADDSKGQLILISHHPEILNQWAHEYGMRMFRDDGGPVQIEKYKTDYDDILKPSEVVARGWEND